MGRKPYVADYGGNCHRGRTKTTTFGRTRTFWCLDCKTMRHCVPNELNRAAKPRCLKCGGPLEETKASTKRQLGTLGTPKERKQRQDDFAAARKTVAEGCKCQSCGASFGGPRMLAHHLRDESACAYDYKADKLVGELYKGTAHLVIRTHGTKKYGVFYLDQARQVVLFRLYLRKADADTAIEILNKGTTLAPARPAETPEEPSHAWKLKPQQP